MNTHNSGPDEELVGAPWVPDSKWRTRPKVTLHDHLDGSVRPATLIEITAEQGGSDVLTSDDPIVVERWLRGIDAGDRPFDHNVTFALLCSVMQTHDSIVRVAAEWVDTLRTDGVVYGEARWAPEKHLDRGLTMDQAVDAVAEGLDLGVRRAAEAGHQIEVRQIVCAIRDTDVAQQIAELAVRHRNNGVVGMDLAGMELGYPAAPHLTAFQYAREHSVPVTIHAGEGDGIDSVRESLHQAHALRLGHGTRLIEDVSANGTPLDATTAVGTVTELDDPDIEFGPIASYVRDLGIPLEQCVTSNSRWVVPGFANHPVDLFHKWGFAVTINPDNRILSGTSITHEFDNLEATFGWTAEDFATVTATAMGKSFADLDTKAAVAEIIDAGWAS